MKNAAQHSAGRYGRIFDLSFYVADQAKKSIKRKDDQRIVIDEIIGFQITMLPAAISILNLCAAFVFFQILISAKPFSVKNMQGFPGGWGIVADDVAAGIYAAWFCGYYDLLENFYMKIGILTIGNELMNGRIADTNRVLHRARSESAGMERGSHHVRRR